jgi:RNA polymerase sigma-70 factor (ECF subfamily)
VTAEPIRSPSTGSTRWTVIRDAALGVTKARDEFARRYEHVIRAYVEARWRGGPLAGHADDAVQDVFLECLRPDGALVRADPAASGGFRAFLFGVTKNVARRIEERRSADRARRGDEAPDLAEVEGRERAASTLFDRAWADSMMQQAASLQEERAEEAGPDAVRRVELLRLRFEESLAVRDIAARWGTDPAWTHRQYATARDEFRRALAEVVRAHEGGTDAEVQAACGRLVDLLR